MYIQVVTYNQGEGNTKGDRDMENVKAILRTRTLEQLVMDFEATTENNDPAIYEVRGWLMDEIAERNPQGFDAWLDSEEPKDEELGQYVL